MQDTLEVGFKKNQKSATKIEKSG